jgi:hypothetical protein
MNAYTRHIGTRIKAASLHGIAPPRATIPIRSSATGIHDARYSNVRDLFVSIGCTD